jgi:hypothetical protein
MARKKTIKPGTVLDVSRPSKTASKDALPQITSNSSISISIDDSNTDYASTEVKDLSSAPMQVAVSQRNRIEHSTAPLLPGTKPVEKKLHVLTPSPISPDNIETVKANSKDKILHVPIPDSIAGSTHDIVNQSLDTHSASVNLVETKAEQMNPEENIEDELGFEELPNPFQSDDSEEQEELFYQSKEQGTDSSGFDIELPLDQYHEEIKEAPKTKPKQIIVETSEEIIKEEPKQEIEAPEEELISIEAEEPTSEQTNKPIETLQPVIKKDETVIKKATTAELTKSKKYHLPINSKQNKKTKRFVVSGVLVALLLIVAGGDLALDLGTYNPSFHIPHTHFFNKTDSSAAKQVQTAAPVALVASPLTSSEQAAKDQADTVVGILAKYYSINTSYPSLLDSSVLISANLGNIYSSSIFTPPVGTTFNYTVFPEGCSDSAVTCLHYTLKVTGERNQTIYLKHE